MRDLIIIGAGPSALFAAFQAGMLGMTSHIVDLMSNIGGQCNLYLDKYIYDIPAYPCITAEHLIKKLKQQCERFQPKYHLGHKIISMKTKSKEALVKLENGDIINGKSIIIASGNGIIEHNKPPIANLEQYENKSAHYSVNDMEIFRDQTIIIAGGGDSAADWTVMLSKIARKIYIIHRRTNFKCMPSTMQMVHNLVKSSNVELLTPYQISKVEGTQGCLKTISVKHITTKQTIEINAQHLLMFFGLKSSNKTLTQWGLDLSKEGSIKVDKINMQTSVENIFAIGDSASYPGKLKLILTGFAEAATACHHIYSVLNPEKKLQICHSTNNSVFA